MPDLLLPNVIAISLDVIVTLLLFSRIFRAGRRPLQSIKPLIKVSRYVCHRFSYLRVVFDFMRQKLHMGV